MGGSVVLQVLLVSLAAGVLLGCSLKNFTLHVEKQECTHCLTINTTVCSGMCFTQVCLYSSPVSLSQRACVYQSVAYRSAEVPGCPAHIDPLYIYPVAQRCRCSKCNTVTNECVQTPLQTALKCLELH
uniref:Glycoprotein hormone subunit beta domain-containing protein n=1 Tax=Astyanax mexicanus TaxID=7994 RepID=A0A8B9H3R5_ASTMX